MLIIENLKKIKKKIKEKIRKGIKVYRGELPEEFKRYKFFQTDVGDLGRGIYYTTSKARAKAIAGKYVYEKFLKLDNPLVISYEEAYKLADKYGTVRYRTIEEGLKNAEKFTLDMLKKGYDGLVAIKFDKLGNVYELEIVDYRPYLKLLQ